MYTCRYPNKKDRAHIVRMKRIQRMHRSHKYRQCRIYSKGCFHNKCRNNNYKCSKNRYKKIKQNRYPIKFRSIYCRNTSVQWYTQSRNIFVDHFWIQIQTRSLSTLANINNIRNDLTQSVNNSEDTSETGTSHNIPVMRTFTPISESKLEKNNHEW